MKIPDDKEFEHAQIAIVDQEQKRTHFTIEEIGGPEELKAYRERMLLVKELEKQLSAAKYQVRRQIAIKMVEDQLSRLQPTKEDDYIDNRPTTKFDKIVDRLRAARKRFFRANSDV